MTWTGKPLHSWVPHYTKSSHLFHSTDWFKAKSTKFPWFFPWYMGVYGGKFLNIRNSKDPALIHRQNVIHWIARPRRRGSRRGACGCALRAPASDSVGRSCDWEPSAIRLRRWSKKHRPSKTMGNFGEIPGMLREISIVICIYEPTVYIYIYMISYKIVLWTVCGKGGSLKPPCCSWRLKL